VDTRSVGKPSTPTPKGTFKIVERAINPGGPFGARWLGLSAPGGDYGIHGTNNPSSIGKAVSNGCVRMYNKDVIELAKIVPIGTVVKIV
jgi:lipoprotein-anchoring transpeptidase ErfK/SrfK